MPRKQHTHHYIYKVTCNVNGKYYVGMHSTSNLEDGYFGSGKVLKRSLNKYGNENHSIEILEWLTDRSSLKLREKELVNESLLNDPMCMNLAIGGEGGFRNSEISRRGAAVMNAKTWSDQVFRDKKSKETSDRNRELHKSGILHAPNWKGKKHSDESRLRMSISAKNRGPEKNSQFGTKWLNDGINDIKAKPENIDHLLKNGWSFGRIKKPK